MDSQALVQKTTPIELAHGERKGTGALPWQFAASGAVLLASTGHLLIKLGLTSAARLSPVVGSADHLLQTLSQPGLLLGLAIYAVGTLLWISAVSRRNISFLYPLTALNYVIVSVGGFLWFGETISTMRWIGISVVVLGVALLQLSSGEEQ